MASITAVSDTSRMTMSQSPPPVAVANLLVQAKGQAPGTALDGQARRFCQCMRQQLGALSASTWRRSQVSTGSGATGHAWACRRVPQ